MGTRTRSSSRAGNLAAMVRVVRTVNHEPAEIAERRKLIADFCKMVGARVGAVVHGTCNDPGLSPRERETLGHLLAGDSEKQVARKLGISPHTVHVHVKRLYKHFEVSSRGELLARCLGGRSQVAGGGDGNRAT